MQEIICSYKKTLYRDFSQGFAIFTISAKDFDEYRTGKGELICRGKIPVYTQNIPLKITGEFVLESKGYIFVVSNSQIYSDNTVKTQAYIESCNIKGIGSKNAEKIANAVCGDFTAFFSDENCVDNLFDTTRIARDKLLQLVEKINKILIQKPVYDFLYEHGGKLEDSCRVCEMYGTRALEELYNNCYEVCNKCNISFFIADSISKSIGGSAYDENRITSLVRHTFLATQNSGHTYSNLDAIVGNVNFLNKKSAFPEPVSRELIFRAIVKDKRFIIETDENGKVRYSYQDVYNAEKKIVSEIKRIQNSAISFNFTKKMFAEIEKSIGITYSEQQKEAFGCLRTSGLKVITGGPGVGKTTVINGIIKAYEKINPYGEISLCAPTGRAAQQMSNSTGRKASTIHRLIDLRPFEESTLQSDSITPINSDVVIIDEASMVDTVIFSLLLSAIKNSALVILCGDSDQLPSVGAGNVLHDIIKSEICEVYKLNKIFRQKGTSNIVMNAANIRENNTEMIQGSDFVIIDASSETEMVETVVSLAEQYYDKYNPYKFQVLSSVKKGDAGVYNLNKILQSVCNPDDGEYGLTRKFRKDDKVMFVVNNYKEGYVNGDIGIVTSVEDDSLVVNVADNEITLSHSKISDLTHAYSMTTHKSQGSEFETVVIVLPKEPKIMLQKKIVYTAITRAKKNVIIIAQNNSLEQSILTDEFSKRRTSLAERLTGKISLVER